MEFLQANWFSLVMLAILIIERAVSYGMRKRKAEETIEKLAKMEKNMKEATDKLDAHITNPDVHVNSLLLKLFDERFETMRKEQSETRNDVKRIETMLQKM